MEEVELLGMWASSFSNKVKIALKMKCIEYEYAEQDLFNKSPELIKFNPIHKKVPVLLHGGKPICESLIILEYIDETWKSAPSILPEDPHARATARFWAKFIDDKCFAAVWKIMETQGEEREKTIEEAKEHLKTLENEIQGRKFFGGDEIGLVDIAATSLTLWLRVFEELAGVELLTKAKFPNLCRWADDYLSNSIVKESLPAKEDLLGFLRAIFRPAI